MKKPSKINIKPKILIFVLTLLCIGSLILSVVAPSFSNPIKTVEEQWLYLYRTE